MRTIAPQTNSLHQQVKSLSNAPALLGSGEASIICLYGGAARYSSHILEHIRDYFDLLEMAFEDVEYYAEVSLFDFKSDDSIKSKNQIVHAYEYCENCDLVSMELVTATAGENGHAIYHYICPGCGYEELKKFFK